MNAYSLALVLSLFLGFTLPAHAVEYYELEVYGYQTAEPHELEMENATSLSSDREDGFSNRILRSTFEFNYGLAENWETSAYFDYTKPVGAEAEFTSFRAHARTRFFEQDDLPADLGAYFEAEFPRNFRAKDVGLEFKPILEKNYSRWIFRLNPGVELSHVAKTEGENSVAVDPDGDVVGTSNQHLSANKVWITEWNVSTSVMYSWNRFLRPHLDYHAGLTDQSALLMPALSVQISRGLSGDLGLGFGLNSHTESRVLALRLELESLLD